MIPTNFRFRRPLSLAIALAFTGSAAHAATITVGDSGDAAALAGCTLREAIGSINSGEATSACNSAVSGSFGANDTIVFDNALVGSTITLSQGQLSVTASLTINGSGQTIDANAQSRVLYVDSGTLMASSLTLADGHVGAYYRGAGVFAYGSIVTLSDTTITGNSASGNGGGVFASHSTVTLSNSVVANNHSDYSGGGVYSGYGTLTMVNTTITANDARYGAGSYNYAASATFTNITVTGNSALLQGGGVYATSGPAIAFANSIVSGNTATGGANISLHGSSTATSDHSLLGSELSANYSGHGNYFADDPKLSALADNGGPTKTMALQSDSPAIDAGDNSLVPGGVQYDQRGAGHPRIVKGTVDMGAFEYGDEIFKDGFD